MACSGDDTGRGSAAVRWITGPCEDGSCVESPPNQYGIGMRITAILRLVALAGVAVLAAGGIAPASAIVAQARPREFDPKLLETGDLIRYRDLSREDFLAADPPAEAAGLHGQLGAATCVFLTTHPNTAIRASSSGLDQQRGLVRAQVEDLGFLAYMDRECSWWNPAPMALPDEYILEHEQIHFALFEIAARRLNRRVETLTRQMGTVSTSQQRALEEVHRQIDVEMQRMIEEVLARSNDFDRETSRTYRRDRQNWWWRTVNLELDRLADIDDRP